MKYLGVVVDTTSFPPELIMPVVQANSADEAMDLLERHYSENGKFTVLTICTPQYLRSLAELLEGPDKPDTAGCPKRAQSGGVKSGRFAPR